MRTKARLIVGIILVPLCLFLILEAFMATVSIESIYRQDALRVQYGYEPYTIYQYIPSYARAIALWIGASTATTGAILLMRGRLSWNPTRRQLARRVRKEWEKRGLTPTDQSLR